MNKPKIETTKSVAPMIYAYTTPGITYHDGYIKIGYTEQDVDARIYQQTHTAGVAAKKEWQGTAIYDDGSFDPFKDKEFHAYLRANGIKQPQDLNNPYFDPKDRNEWFYASPVESRGYFFDFKSNRGKTVSNVSTVPYTLRKEQADAVAKTIAYFDATPNGEFLWNCKPRFGKTLSVYDLVKQKHYTKVLIVTNRPAIANSWYSDYMQFVGTDSYWWFVSETDALKGRPGVVSRDEYLNNVIGKKEKVGCIEFVSLQDMKGSLYFADHGAGIDKLSEVANMQWDLLVVDEAHEGVDTYKTDIAFERIHRDYTLHLSGTPFKAIASAKFPSNAIYNWTYADEQRAKAEWSSASGEENPYAILPQINLYTYQMSEIIADQLKQGIEIQGETEEYAFDLNEFFRVENGRFVYNASVDRFLDALTTQKKFPFSTMELRDELKHTFWLLNRVESARLLAKKLQEHPVFQEYKVVLAAGDGKIDDSDASEKSYDKVVKAIKENDKTITLSVGQLTVGVTIPEWTAVLILSNVKSPALYMQAAFRAQNPCLFTRGKDYLRKENAYVFDFDPARSLTIYEEFANDLIPATAAGRGDLESRKANIKAFLNFFPVIGEDEEGELVELDAEQVLTLPRKIRSMEVVRRGFLSNFLFANISNIFNAPPEVREILEKIAPAQEEKGPKPAPITFPPDVRDKLGIDKNGDVTVDDTFVKQTAEKIFGDKIPAPVEAVEAAIPATKDPSDQKGREKALVEVLKDAVTDVVGKVKGAYGDDLRPSDAKRLESQMKQKVEQTVNKEFAQRNIDQNILDKQRKEAMQARHETGKSAEEIDVEFEKKASEIDDNLKKRLQTFVEDFFDDAKQETVKTVEKSKREKEKKTIEEDVRSHLRGFARTIPSFLMAYGDDTVTLATFDEKVPGNVFLDVTSISLEDFRKLRDGGTWVDPETGETKEYHVSLFDEVVFDDSVKEFLALKKRLADYFDDKSIEDIFDYIPPQKTFQIYTPKTVVQKMVDQLEAENPGCFDDPNHTFIDLYMKSGLYPAEIVKRLYRSPKMKELFPDGKERLRHIFKKQVYGLAPTEIIYNIAVSFLLGFNEEVADFEHNFRQVDALPYAKNGTLQQKLDELFGDDE